MIITNVADLKKHLGAFYFEVYSEIEAQYPNQELFLITAVAEDRGDDNFHTEMAFSIPGKMDVLYITTGHHKDTHDGYIDEFYEEEKSKVFGYLRLPTPMTFISEGGWGSLSKEEIADIIKAPKKDFREELEALIEQAHQAGYIDACWCDGANISNEHHDKSEADLRLAVKQFLDKYNDTPTNS